MDEASRLDLVRNWTLRMGLLIGTRIGLGPGAAKLVAWPKPRALHEIQMAEVVISIGCLILIPHHYRAGTHADQGEFTRIEIECADLPAKLEDDNFSG